MNVQRNVYEVYKVLEYFVYNISSNLGGVFIFDWLFFNFTGNKDNHKVSNGLKPWTVEIAALERLKKSP